MNHCGGIHHQKFGSSSSCEEMRSFDNNNNNNNGMVCPKPRRLSTDPVRPLRWQISHQSQGYDSKPGPDLLDIIFAKTSSGASDQPCTQVASSPPFFSGSPPTRVSNPLIQDARFGDDPRSSSSGLASSSARTGVGCLHPNFGNKPVVRVEGFDCLNRDNRRNCSIPTLA